MRPGDVRLRCSVQNPADDASPVGGPVDHTAKPSLRSFTGDWRAVSSDPYDDTDVEVEWRDEDGDVQAAVVTLDGQAPVDGPEPVTGRVLRVRKVGPTDGDVAVYSTDLLVDEVALGPGPGSDTVELPPLGLTRESLLGCVVRRPDVGELAYVADYDPDTGVLVASWPWVSSVTYASPIEVSAGAVLDPGVESAERLLRDAEADGPFGSDRTFYAKVHLANVSYEDLDDAEVVGAGVPFAVDPGIDDYPSTTAVNRRQMPDGFDDSDFNADPKPVPGDVLPAHSSIGVWLKLSAPAGTQDQAPLWSLGVRGTFTE